MRVAGVQWELVSVLVLVLPLRMSALQATPSGSNPGSQQHGRLTALVTAADVARLRIVDGSTTTLASISDDSLEFGRVGSGCFLESGEAVVLSAAPPKLIYLSTTPSVVARIVGKRGDGPGEFQQPWTVSCFGTDSVAVLEPFRVSVGVPARPPLRTHAINVSANTHWVEPVFQSANGRYLLRSRPKSPSDILGTYRDTVELLVGDPTKEDTSHYSRLGRFPSGEYVRVRLDGRTTTAVHPVGRALLVAAAHKGTYLMETGTPELMIVDDRGRTTSSVRFALSGRAVTSEFWRRQSQVRREAVRMPAQRRIAETLLEQMSVPKQAPLFDRLVAIRGGGVWLREFAFEGEKDAVWMQLDGEDRPVLRWRLPITTRILAADSMHVLCVSSRDDGVTVEILERPRTWSPP
ncbi:MAG: hypothetical protein IT359_13990 [Gemmatimonadaceae bacterium]|nr:hypothetical protein [Gemmatimonadaceae bacterium]